MSSTRTFLATPQRSPWSGFRQGRMRAMGGLLLIITALLVACGEDPVFRAQSERVGMIGSMEENAASDIVLARSMSAQGEDAEAAEPATPRKLIQNAELHLEVEACDDARRTIEAKLAEIGGYLASANVSHHDGRVSRAVLVLRIPATTLGSSLESFSGLGTVVYESLTTQDITEEYFDMEARLGSARKLEARLLELLATETEDLKDLLEVERELARVRETVERFEGKLRLWERQVAFSTLTIELITHELYAAAAPRTLGEQVTGTLAGSWNALVTAGRALVLVVVAILPWVLPLLLLGWLFLRFVRRLGRNMAAKSLARRQEHATPPPTPPRG